MKTKIYCRQCKSESLLTTKKVMNLIEAKEIIKSIEEVLERHRSHPEFIDVTVFEKDDINVDGATTRQYIYDALQDRIHKYEHK